MRLCFGTFARLLNHCRKKSINQARFVGRIAWVIDKKNSCLWVVSKDDDTKDKNAGITAEDLKENVFEENSSVVSRLLNCAQSFENRSGKRPPFSNAKKDFSEMVSPMIKDGSKPSIILALLELIRYDDSIDSKRSECFERCFGTSKGQLFYTPEFDFSEIMTKALLYVTSPEIENRNSENFSAPTFIVEDGEEDIPDIFAPKQLPGFLLKYARNQNWFEAYWNSDTETLHLVVRASKILADHMYTLIKRESELLEKKVIMDFHFDSDMHNLNEMIRARLNIKKLEYHDDDYLTIEKMREYLSAYKKLLKELVDCSQEFMQVQNVLLNVLPTKPDQRMEQMYNQIKKVYWEMDKLLTEL